jgi:hypothetical protein
MKNSTMLANRRGWILAALLLMTVVVTGCSQPTGPTGQDLCDLAPITLTVQQKAAALLMTRAYLTGESFARDPQHEVLFAQSPRGAFISVMRKNENALTTFGAGNSIADALEKAAELMLRLGENEDLSALRLRIDIMEASQSPKIYTVAEKWRTREREKTGLLFLTEPLLALLPDELIDRSVINYEGDFHRLYLSRLVDDRMTGRLLRNLFEDNDAVDYCAFSTISFLEGEDRKGVESLTYGRAQPPATDADYLLDAATRAGDYLMDITDPDGWIHYVYYPQSNRISSATNLRRHATAITSMLNLFETTHNPKLLDAADRAIDYLVKNVKGPSDADSAKGVSFKAVYNGKDQAKAGATGQAMVAIADYIRLTGKNDRLELLREMAAFIKQMTAADGTLTPVYYRTKKSRQKVSGVTHYPSECALGLLALNRVDPNPEWVALAKRLVDRVLADRNPLVGVRRMPQDYWLAEAAVLLFPAMENDDLKNHLYAMGEAIIERIQTTGVRSDWVGGYGRPPKGRTTASRNRAVLAIYKVAAQAGDPTDRWLQAANQMAAFQLRHQIDSVSAMFFKHPEKAINAFIAEYGNPQIRLDAMGHNIDTLLAIHRIYQKAPVNEKTEAP